MKKTLKKSIIILLLLMLILSINAYAYTMYALDGRTIEISYNNADAWRNVGWYDAPVTTMYAPDGRTEVIYKFDVAAWENVGWYDGNKIINIYSPDGRTIAIYGYQLQSYKDVGWYEYPVVRLYSSDERSIVVAKSDILKWNNVGWYTAPAHGKTALLNMLSGFWVNESTAVYVSGGYNTGIPFIEFNGNNMNLGWSFDYYSDGIINSLTLVGNNLYKIDLKSTIVCVDDDNRGDIIKNVTYIYYNGGDTFVNTGGTIFFSENNSPQTWKYVGDIENWLNNRSR